MGESSDRWVIPAEVIPETTRIKDLWMTRPLDVNADTVSTSAEVDAALAREYGARFAETIDLLGQFEARLRCLEGTLKITRRDGGVTFEEIPRE